jgi:hypothetical protein
VERLHLGLRLRSPVLHLSESLDYRGIQQQTSADGMTNFAFYDRSEAGVGILEQPRFLLGGAWSFDRGWLAVGVDYAPAVQSLDVRSDLERAAGEPRRWVVDRRHNVNARIGGMFDMGKIALGVGAFTDRSAERRPQNFGDLRVDFYGLTLGLRTETNVKLDHERIDTLKFRTTIAIRYALGLGDTAVLEYDQSGPGLTFNESTGELRDVRFHELYVFLGSSLLF